MNQVVIITNKIRLLDKKTINQIAAGEVVERPASVVKELVENAIDANSRKIIIELEYAGKKLIRITDDGSGIAPDELKLAFEKHSTSKIHNINDVYRLSTLGFRGEALASIAAVARVECVSCDGKHIPGRKLVLEGGNVISFGEIGCAKGTTIKVKDLFYNLPARYKYLKSDQTELAHIMETITHLAIYHNNISFKLIHNQNELLNFPGTTNQINNLVNIYGKELARELLPLSSPRSLHDNVRTKLSVLGHIGKPSLTRSDRSYQSMYVNGRYVESKVVSDAVKDAYRTLVMKNRHPFVILFFEIDPGAVDVNISPTKLQVRFEAESEVYKFVYTRIRDTLRSHDLIPEVELQNKPHTVSLKAITTLGIGKPGFIPPLPESVHTEGINGITQQDTLSKHLAGRSQHSPITFAGREESVMSGTTLPRIRIIGQIMDTYIIAQAGENMLIIDQHAAHERIMYEKIKKRYLHSRMSTQELLEPVELELSPKEIGLLLTSLDTFNDLSFTIDELGDKKFYVKGIPVILGRLQEPEFIRDMINDMLAITQDKKYEHVKDKLVQVMACKAAIKAGKTLNIPEIQQILSELYSIENPYTCAHGRPTIILMSEKQLQKLFKRIV